MLTATAAFTNRLCSHWPRVVGLAAIAGWTRFNWDRSSQNFFLFAAFAGLAVFYAPYGLVTSGGTGESDLLTGPISRTMFGLGVLAAVAGFQVPSITRLPAWLIGALVVTAAIGASVAIHSAVLEDIYISNPGDSLKRLEGMGFALNLAALVYVSRAWWRTRRPFLIYVIGTVSALMLGTTLFLSTEPWDGRWWVAHLGVVVSAIVVGEGMIAETFRRGKLSEVMDLGGLSQLAESTVATMRDGLALHDAAGTLVGWNPAAEQITGWSRDIASVRLTSDLPEGNVNLTGEKWVDVRHFTVHQNSYYYQATLFTDITERRQAEEALRESEERYRSLVEASPDAVLLTDLDGRILLCNRRAAALHGYETGEELLGKSSFDLIAPEDRERAMANAMRTVQSGGVRDVQYRTVGRDGGSFLAEQSASVIRDADGRPRAFTAIVRDVTERKQTEEALQRSEEHFRSLTENLSDVIFIIDADGTISYESPSVERVLGQKPDSRVGQKVFDYAHPDDLSRMVEAFGPAIDHPGSLNTAVFRVRHEDGSWRDLECVGRIRASDDGQTEAIITARDVTERRTADEALRESEERYRGLVQASPDAVALMGLDGRILLCNEQAASLHGFKAVDYLVGLNGFHFIAPNHREEAIASILEAVQAGTVARIEYDVLRRDGSRFPAEISVSRIQDTAEQPVGLTAVWRDISERRHAEHELRKTSALVELLGSVAGAANEAADLQSVLEPTLAGVCAYVGWTAGHAYVQAKDAPEQLVSSGVWRLLDPVAMETFKTATEEARFGPDEGHVGKVLSTGRPAWTEDISRAHIAGRQGRARGGGKGCIRLPRARAR